MISNIFATVTVRIKIPENAWVSEESDGFAYLADIPCGDITERHYPNVTLDKSSLGIASNAGLCPTVQSLDGKLRFWAKTNPSDEITGTVLLIYASGNKANSIEISGNSVIPIATAFVVGGVKIQSNSGLSVDENGNLSVDTTGLIEKISATDDEMHEIINKHFCES